jgi:hypothetical protein
MVPRLSRRRVLGGVGAAGVLGVAGALGLPASSLPDSVVRYRLGLVPVPPFEWHPPVSEAHLAEGVSHLRDAVSRAERAWESIDRSSLSEQADVYPVQLDSARRHLRAAEGASPSRDSLFDVLNGIGDAGSAIGGARVVRDRTDPESVVRRGREIRRRIADAREAISSRVRTPATDLAHLHAAERQLVFAGLNSYAEGTYAGGVRPASAFDDRAVVWTWEAHFEARQYRRNALRYAKTSPEPDQAGGGLGMDKQIRDALADFDEEIRSFRESEGAHDARLDQYPDGPYRTVRRRLWRYTHDLEPHPDEGPWSGLTLYRAVEAARNVLKLRAYDTALDELAIAEGDAVSVEAVAEAKRRAARRARAVEPALADAPFARTVLAPVGRMFESGRLDAGIVGRSDRDRELADAYASYLVAGAELEHARSVLDRFLGRDTRES